MWPWAIFLDQLSSITPILGHISLSSIIISFFYGLLFLVHDDKDFKLQRIVVASLGYGVVSAAC